MRATLVRDSITLTSVGVVLDMIRRSNSSHVKREQHVDIVHTFSRPGAVVDMSRPSKLRPLPMNSPYGTASRLIDSEPSSM